MKTFFVVPGFKDRPNNRMYKWLKTFLSSKKYKVEVAPITWNKKTISENAKEFEDFYNNHKSSENYVLGFSFGAMIAFITAEKLKPKKLFLCSLSAYFKEDIKTRKQWVWDSLGKRRTEDFKKISAKNIAEKLHVPTVVFYGEKESKHYPELKNRCIQTAKLIRNAKLVEVKKSLHDISDPEYRKALKLQF